jgi:membrane-associated phospholipid phosphatase
MFNSNFWQFFQPFLRSLKHLLVARWRSILLLLVGVFFPLQIFGELAEEVWENEGGFPWDVPILLAIHSHARPQLDFLASTVTKTGGFWGVTLMSTAIALFLLLRRQRRLLVYFLIAMIGNGLINRVAKELLHRVRPHLWNSPAPEYDYGFPSGHAMGSMALVATLFILTRNNRWRWLVLAVGSVYVIVIACTRLYLGVHYPSDILAGWMAAIAWTVGVSLVIRPHVASKESK